MTSLFSSYQTFGGNKIYSLLFALLGIDNTIGIDNRI